MKEGEDLWKKYCSFFEKDFSDQLEYNERKMREYFDKWKSTKMAKQLCPKGVEKFEDIPLTTYEDYPILHEFGAKVEHLSKTVPRKKGELLWDYYVRISKQVAPMLDGWMVDEYAFCLKTSGSGGEPKWFAHGKTYSENVMQGGPQVAIFACSDDWGTTEIKEGDRFLNLGALPPYGSAVGTKSFGVLLEAVPPAHVVDRIADMRKKMNLMYETVERGKRVTFTSSPASVLSLIAKYFVEPESLYRDRYQSMNPGMAKFVLYMKYLQSKLNGRRYGKANEVLPLKGFASTAWDGTIYLEYLRDQFNIEPFNLYAASDTLLPLMGRPHRKFDLFPNLQNGYFDFLADDDEIMKIDQLKKNHSYELVVTTFGSMTLRYRMGDLFRVIDIEDDGTPVFRFESRKTGMIDIYGYFRLSEAIVRDALHKIGMPATDNWVVTQKLHPKEKVCILMEKEWEYSEVQAAKLIFEVLRKMNPDFESFVKDYQIKDCSEILEVEYLRKGAFMRYIMKKAKEGVPMGQIKTPKIIGPEKRELADLLRKI